MQVPEEGSAAREVVRAETGAGAAPYPLLCIRSSHRCIPEGKECVGIASTERESMSEVADASMLLGFLPPEAVEFTDVQVGRGGSGIVTRGWLRRDDRTRTEVAIKALAPGATKREIKQFQKEFAISFRASQRCRGACVMYGCCHRGTDLCLVMKLYTGGSLHEMLDGRRDRRDESRREPLPLPQVVATAMQLAEALSQLHSEKVVCGDLKPGNVLLDENGGLVISDFGLAVVLERTIMRASTTRTDGVGTAAYMAPEQHDSETFGSVSEKTDIWALGCIIVEMLSGEVPWAGKRPTEILMTVVVKQRAPPIPDGLPEALQSALRGCFSHDQAARFSAEDVIAALRPLLPEQPAASGQEVQRMAEVQQLQAAVTQLQAANTQLQGQVAAMAQQMAQQMAAQALQTQRDIADVQKQADQKLANLSRQLQEEMQRQIAKHAADAHTPLVAQRPSDLEQQLPEQQAPEPEPQSRLARPPSPAISATTAARSAAAAAGGADPLAQEMEKNGLTAEDQAALLKGGVTDVSFFRTLDATDFSAVGIDIAARRAAKAKADKERADAAEVLELLQREGGAISPAGQQAIVHSAGTMAKLCALEPAGMQKLGLGIADIRHLRNLLEKSPAVARWQLRQQHPELEMVTETTLDTLVAATLGDASSLAKLRNSDSEKKALLAKLSSADASIVERLLGPVRRPVTPVLEVPTGRGFTVQPDGKIRCPSGDAFLLTTQGIVDLTVAVTGNNSWLIGLVPNGADTAAWYKDESSLAVNCDAVGTGFPKNRKIHGKTVRVWLSDDSSELHFSSDGEEFQRLSVPTHLRVPTGARLGLMGWGNTTVEPKAALGVTDAPGSPVRSARPSNWQPPSYSGPHWGKWGATKAEAAELCCLTSFGNGMKCCMCHCKPDASESCPANCGKGNCFGSNYWGSHWTCCGASLPSSTNCRPHRV